MIRFRWLLAALALAGTFVCATLVFKRAAHAADSSHERMLYAGGTTRGAGDGLAMLRFDTRTGVLSEPRLAAPMANPDWIEMSPDGQTLYAVGAPGGKKGLTAFAIERDGNLRETSAQFDSENPVSLAIDASGKWLVGAHYNAGDWGIWSLGSDGEIGPRQGSIAHQGSGPNANRQSGPHPHQVMISPDNRRIWVVDLGTDKAMISDFDARTGAVTPSAPAFVAVAAGSGPRHLAFGRTGRFVYLVNELSNTVSVFQGGRGAPGAIQTISTLPPKFIGTSYSAEILVSPDGKWVFASNRGYNSIARFAIKRDGTLKQSGWTKVGKEPRHFTFDPTGKWVLVANQKERSISVFAFDAKTGDLTFSSETKGVMNEPTCLVFGKSNGR